MSRSLTFKIFLILLYSTTLLAFLYYFQKGVDFYFTPIQMRPRLSQYSLWKSAGIYSHGFGILGTVMIILLFLYSARKRIKIFKNFGNLSYFLDIHIFLGIFGPLFVILHSTFKLNGIVAVSFWSMVAVALSGIIGRFLYLQIPRNKKGIELTRDEIKNRQLEFIKEMSINLDEESDFLEKLQELINPVGENQNKRFSFFIPQYKIDLKKHINLWGKQNKLSPQRIKYLISLSIKYMKLKRQSNLMDVFQKYFHYWHVFHKPFAYLMIIIMLIHVVVVFLMGYRWIF